MCGPFKGIFPYIWYTAFHWWTLAIKGKKNTSLKVIEPLIRLLVYHSLPLLYIRFYLSTRYESIVPPSFISSEENSPGNGVSAIIVEKERRRAQLFTLSPPPHSYAEQASAGRSEEREGRSVTVSHRMTYFSKDPNTNRCKHTSRTQRNLGFRNCSVEDIKKNLSNRTLCHFFPCHCTYVLLKLNL